MPIIRLTGIGLYSLSRLAVGDIKEIIVRWTGGGYFELDDTSHVIINGDGRAFTNNFSFLDQKYDPYYKEGVALVALLAGKGACVAGARDKIKETREQMWKDGLEEHLSAQSGAGDRLKERVGGGGVWRRKDYNPPPSLRSGAPLTGGTIQATESRISDKINLAFYPCEMGTGGEVIRMRTQAVLDDMKKGLYRSINPALAERTIGALRSH